MVIHVIYLDFIGGVNLMIDSSYYPLKKRTEWRKVLCRGIASVPTPNPYGQT